jgi:uncharacterized protein YecT (DUF1311 family)
MTNLLHGISIAACAALLFATASLAEDEPDCKDPQDQSSMTFCAGKDFEKADQTLNAIWPKLKADALESDKNIGNGTTEYMDALLKSQRAWLSYRDAECLWQGFEAHGGSMEPMLVNACMAQLTEERIKQLTPPEQ